MQYLSEAPARPGSNRAVGTEQFGEDEETRQWILSQLPPAKRDRISRLEALHTQMRWMTLRWIF